MTDDTLDRAIRALYEEAELSEAVLERLDPKPVTRWSPLYTALVVLAAAATLFVATQARPPTATAPAPAPAVAPAAEELTWTITIAEVDLADLEGHDLLDEPDTMQVLAADFEVPEGATIVSKPAIVTAYEQTGRFIIGEEAPDRLDMQLVAHHAGDEMISVYAIVALWGQEKGSGPHEIGPIERPVKLGLASQVDGTWFLVVVEV